MRKQTISILVFILTFSLCPISSFAKLGTYLVKLNSKPIRVLDSVQGMPAASKISQDIRFTITKFTVRRTPSGPSVVFQRVCELNASLPVDDFTGGGGLVEEKVIGSCESTIRNQTVRVYLSGFIYDSLSAYFEDESEGLTRNFFSHLFLQGSGTIAFGLGDFNLANTRAMPFEHLASDLSTDATGGGGASSMASEREGFVATVRYGH